MPILSADPLNPQEQTHPVSTTGEVVGAEFGSVFYGNPIANMLTNDALNRDEFGFQPTDNSTAIAPGPRWSAIQAQQQLTAAGLSNDLKIPAAGIGKASLQILMDRKSAELKKQTIDAEASGGFWQGGAKVGAGFAASLTDPVNIAAGFVPIVGDAKYAEWLAGAGNALGRAGVRAGVGFAEGTAGFVPVEAYNYETKQRLQADYSGYDSLLSIAGGGVFGSALHAGAGFLGDTAGRALGFEPAWVKAARDAREQRAQDVLTTTDSTTDAASPIARPEPSAGDAAVADHFAQEARDRATIIDRLAEGRPLTREAAEVQAIASLRDEVRAGLLGDAGQAADPGVIASAKAELDGVTSELSGLEGERRQLTQDINSQPGVTRKAAESKANQTLEQRRLDLEARRTRAESIIAGNKTASDATTTLSRLDRGEIPPEFAPRVKAEADRLLGSSGELPLSEGIRAALHNDPFAPVRPFLAKMQPETQAAALRMGIAQAATGRAIDVTPTLLGDPAFASHAAEVGALIRQRAAAQGVATADHAAAAAADTQIADSFKGELVHEARSLVSAEESDLRALAKQSGADITDQLAAVAETMQRAKAAGEAARAAALCAMRTGG